MHVTFLSQIPTLGLYSSGGLEKNLVIGIMYLLLVTFEIK